MERRPRGATVRSCPQLRRLGAPRQACRAGRSNSATMKRRNITMTKPPWAASSRSASCWRLLRSSWDDPRGPGCQAHPGGRGPRHGRAWSSTRGICFIRIESRPRSAGLVALRKRAYRVATVSCNHQTPDAGERLVTRRRSAAESALSRGRCEDTCDREIMGRLGACFLRECSIHRSARDDQLLLSRRRISRMRCLIGSTNEAMQWCRSL